MSFVERLVKNASLSVVAGVGSAVGSLVAAAVVGRTLGVSGTASVAMSLWIIFLVLTVADIGVTASLARFMPETAREGAPQLRTFVWDRFKFLLGAIGLGLLLCGLILLFYWPDMLAKYAASRSEAYALSAVIALCCVVHMLFAFSYQYLRGLADFRQIAAFSIVGTLVQIAGVLAGSLWFGVVGALAGYMLASVPMLWVLLRLRPSGEPVGENKRAAVRRYAWTSYAASLMSPLLWVRADLLIVDQIADTHAVGLFAAASAFAALLLQACLMVCNALLPSILHASAEQPASFERTCRATTRFGIFVLLPICFIGAALAPRVIGFIYGGEFEGAGASASLLAIAAGASAITLVLTGVLNAAHANLPLARSGGVGAVLTVVLGILFVSRFGLVGAALGRVGAQSVVAMLTVIAANREVSGVVEKGWFSRILGTSAVAGVAAWLAAVGPGLVGVLTGGMAGVVTFAVLTLLTLRFVEGDRRELLQAVAGRGPRVRRAARLLLGEAGGRDG